MHIITADGQLALPTASRALRDMILAAFRVAPPCPFGGNTGLPASAADLIEHNVVLAVTPVTARLFDAALVRYAAASRRRRAGPGRIAPRDAGPGQG